MKRKNRFDGVDVAAMVAHLQKTLIGHKVANVYDGWTDKMYLFKLAGGSAAAAAEQQEQDTSTNRRMLLLESGVRFHIASSSQQQKHSSNATMPSGFAMKLRKHLRGLRFESIKQLGSLDRVVDIRFGSGESAHHILLELYSQGNIILADRDYVILALLREHEYSTTSNNIPQTETEAPPTPTGPEAAPVKVAVRQVYPVTFATTLTSATNNKNSTDSTTASSSTFTGLLSMTTGQEAYQWAKQEILQARAQQQLNEEKKKNKKKSAQKQSSSTNDHSSTSMALKALLLRKSSGVHHYGPSVIEHCILSINLDPNMLVCVPHNEDEDVLITLFEKLMKELQTEGNNILDAFYQNSKGGGYILYTTSDTNKQQNADENQLQDDGQDKIFLEFLPHLLRQHYNSIYIEYDNFSDAVDTFFSSMEGQLLRQRYEAAEQAARDRLSKIKQDQNQRLENLQREQNMFLTEARAIEQHADVVDKALLVVNSALQCNMSWNDLDQLLQMEKSNNNPIALLIHKLDYEREAIVIELPNAVDNDVTIEDGTTNNKVCLVKVGFSRTAHGNAQEMYDKYRQAKEKYEKTAGGMTKALKAAEAVVQKQLQEVQQKQRRLATTTPVARKINWFEKFNWFITSDNYLVIAGRDAQQNELVVKRYLRPGDAYLHADVHGAASCILRAKRVRRRNNNSTNTNKTTDVLPPSEIALREAGNFTICRSSAWSSKMITSAWWVESHQVSKTAPTGEYLTVGSFMIRGRKNFLPPSPLEMGMALLFRLGDESSIARHANERRDFALGEDGAVVVDDDEMLLPDEMDKEELVPLEKLRTLTPKETLSAVAESIEHASSDVDARPLPVDDTFLAKKCDAAYQRLSTEETVKIEQPLLGHVLDEDQQLLDGSSKILMMGVKTDSPSKSKKGLSAHDRKLINKYGSLEAADKASQKENGGNKGSKAETSLQISLSTVIEVQYKATKEKDSVVRGKKGKSKKVLKKYADQDDEDRELAMLALQGGENKQKAMGKLNKKSVSAASHSTLQRQAAAETSALLRKDASEVAIALDEEVRNILVECVTVNGEVQWNKFDADVLEQVLQERKENQVAVAKRLLALTKTKPIDNFSASLSGIVRTVQRYGPDDFLSCSETIRSEKKKGKEKKSEKEEWKEVLAEEGIVEDAEIDDGAVDDTAELSKLTGLPVDDDILMYAIPVCAPYSSLTKYKYRVKLTPGSLKRGKAVKQCLEMFVRGGEVASNSKNGVLSSNNRTRDLIKAIAEPEWVQAICGDVKISAPGASKMAKMQKANSKKGGKKK